MKVAEVDCLEGLPDQRLGESHRYLKFFYLDTYYILDIRF